MKTLVLLRHGQSVWNRENRFTGWTDVGLSERGVAEAVAAGRLLAAGGFDFDVAFTSLLKRAILTLCHVLEETDRLWLPVHKTWRLNERHYGALQGLDKTETVARHGLEQVALWRRSYRVRPPALELGDPRWPGADRRYAALRPDEVPLTESLEDTVARFLPFWRETLAPAVREGRRVLVVAHGNSLRALLKHLEGVTDEAISALEIPTGTPLVCELEDDLTPVRRFYLGEAEGAARP